MAAFTITVSNTGSTQSPAGVINQGDTLSFAADPSGAPPNVYFKNAKTSPFTDSTVVAVPSSAPVTSQRSGSFDFESADKGGIKLGTVVIDLSITVSSGSASPALLKTVTGQQVNWIKGPGGPDVVQFNGKQPFGSKDLALGRSHQATSTGQGVVYTWATTSIDAGVGSGTIDVGTGP
jgi:hypothetical protein